MLSLPSRFQPKGDLGTGFTGAVVLAYDTHLKQQVAVKTLSKELYERFRLPYPPPEIALVSSLSHAHLVRVLDVVEEPSCTLLVQEYLSGGDLFQCMQESDLFPEVLARLLFGDLLAAVSYLHCKGIVHRDIKPENCVLDENGKLMLVDFGFATEFVPGQLFEDYCASREYAAPEVLLRKPYEGPPVDVWALGMLLYDMVLGDLPQRDADGVSVLLVDDDSAITMELYALLEHTLRSNPKQRATVFDLADAPWMSLLIVESGDGGITLEGSLAGVTPQDMAHRALQKRIILEYLALTSGQPPRRGTTSFC